MAVQALGDCSSDSDCAKINHTGVFRTSDYCSFEATLGTQNKTCSCDSSTGYDSCKLRGMCADACSQPAVVRRMARQNALVSAPPAAARRLLRSRRLLFAPARSAGRLLAWRRPACPRQQPPHHAAWSRTRAVSDERSSPDFSPPFPNPAPPLRSSRCATRRRRTPAPRARPACRSPPTPTSRPSASASPAPTALRWWRPAPTPARASRPTRWSTMFSSPTTVMVLLSCSTAP